MCVYIGDDKDLEIRKFSENVHNLLTKSTIFVLPSLYGEGCPTVVLEAFRAKLPVIAYDIDGLSELIDNNKNGYLIPPLIQSKMSKKILYLLSNLEITREMSEASYAKFHNNFLIENMCFKHQRVFNNIFNKI